MRCIAVMNQKGGVGKTTTAVNLSAALALDGHRVCLMDLDPQAHASLHLGVATADDEPNIYNLLTSPIDVGRVRREVDENLFLIPSHLDLAAAELELADQPRRELILRDRLLGDPDPFDYCLIDCPPSLGMLTLNALTAADEVLLPLQPHFLALHGLSRLLKTIDLIAQRLNRDLKLGGVLLCLYDSGTRLAAEVSSDVESFFDEESPGPSSWSNGVVFQTRIRRNIRLAEAPSHGQSIFEYAPHSHGAVDYRKLSRELTSLHQTRRRAA